MSWKELTGDDVPRWLRKKADKTRKRNPEIVGETEIVNGDTFVYKIEYDAGHHGHFHDYYRQPCSEYYVTTNKEGTCPNCQKYVRRKETDDVLTCHRCGWKYTPTPSLPERVAMKLPW